jgi:hypothetical protein
MLPQLPLEGVGRRRAIKGVEITDEIGPLAVDTVALGGYAPKLGLRIVGGEEGGPTGA